MPSRFDIDAIADPGLMCRMLGYFAQCDLTPERVDASVVDERLSMSVIQPGIDNRLSRILAEKLARIVGVIDVRLNGSALELAPTAHPSA